jgi:hypothetical protein
MIEIENQTTKRTMMHFSYQEREKKKTNDHLRQFHHYTPIRATPCERGDGCVSSETMEIQIWPPGDVTRVT